MLFYKGENQINGSIMTKADVQLEIQTLGNKFGALMKLFDSNNSNLDIISEQYSQLKLNVKDRLAELQKMEKLGRLNDFGQNFLLPCINKVSLNCNARVGSKNKQDLSSSIYDGQDYCSYWLSRLDD